jgi:flagellar protein FliS
MTSNLKSLRAYRETAARTASPGTLVLMLFDGALRFMEMAMNGFAETHFIKRNEQINNNIFKAHAILAELKVTLDFKAGGEFSERMHALYTYMQEQLLLANSRKEPAPIEIVQELLGQIRDAWAEMLRNQVCQPQPLAA